MQALLRVAGAGLLLAAAGIHLDLYLTGYQSIPTIGWLFLLQVIVGIGIGLGVLATGSRLVAMAGAAFALATLGGYLISLQFGLFAFREVRTTAGIVAGIIEVAAFAALAVYAVGPDTGDSGAAAGRPAASRRLPGRGAPTWLRLSMQQAGLGAAAVSIVALGLLGAALAGSPAGQPAGNPPAGSQPGQSAGTALSTAKIGGVTVLTNAAGRTLYWFGPDPAMRSVCTGSCASYWPPVPGPLSAGQSVPGRLGTIRRADGSVQGTYDGHPLYTYVGDSGPGQAHGNGLNLNGGVWHEVTVDG